MNARPWFVTIAEGVAGRHHTYVEAFDSALKWPLRPTKRREWRI